MVRKLPWDRRTTRPRDAVQRHSSSPHPAPGAQNDDSPQTRGIQPSASRGTRESAVSRKCRSPSTSPPPAAPSERFMIDGMDHDDRFRMVEDELLSVAHEFTAHLHAAEYQRLKTTAKSLGSEAIRTISRPVTDGPTSSVRRQQEAARRAEKLHRGLERAFGSGGADGDEDTGMLEDAPWKGTTLQNIMEGSTRKAALVPLLAPSARRPAGANKVEDETEDDEDEDDDDDDLDGPSILRQSILRQDQTVAADKPTFSFTSTATTTERRPDTDRDNGDTDGGDASDSLDMGDLLQKMHQRRQREKEQRQQHRQRRRQEQQRDTGVDVLGQRLKTSSGQSS